MTRFSRALTVGTIILAAASIWSCVPATRVPIQGTKLLEKTKAGQEKAITVPEGTFLFRNLSLAYKKLPPYLSPTDSRLTKAALKGEVENRTQKHWLHAKFKVTLRGADEDPLPVHKDRPERDYIVINDFKPGESRDIGGPSGKELRIHDHVTIVGYNIEYAGGHYPARYSFVMTRPSPSKELHFEDRFIRISFDISKRQMAFTLANKTTKPLLIDWNETRYTDASGTRHRIMHVGTSFAQREELQAPTVVSPGDSREDGVFPIDYVFSAATAVGGWFKLPLFPEGPEAGYLEGRTVGLALPLIVTGKRKIYQFIFRVDKVGM